MSSRTSLARRVALAGVLASGVVLLIAGMALNRSPVAMAGLGALLLAATALIWGLRHRLERTLASSEELQGEISRMRRSQVAMHGRISARLQDQRRRLERMRESQLKLHSRVALQSMTFTRHQNALRDELGGLLEQARQAGVDAQTLALRSYREAHQEWTRVHALIEAQGRDAKGLVEVLNRVSEVQREEAERAARQFGTLAAAIERESADVAKLTGTVAAKLDAVDERAGEFIERFHAEAGRQQEIGADVQSKLDGLVGDVHTSSQEIAAAAAAARSLLDQLTVIESATASVADYIRSEAPRQGQLTHELRGAIEELGGEVAGDIREDIKTLREAWMQGKTKLLTRSDQNRRELQQAVEAILQLQELHLVQPPHPLMDGWAMDPVSVLSTLRLIMERRPSLVVECGSGTSTIWIAAALKQLGSGRVVSLEHLEEYAERTREALSQQGLLGFADVRYAPLAEISVDDRASQWYDPAFVADLARVDLLLVDGPPKSVGEHSRHPAVPVLADKLVPGAIIVVDDTDRPAEIESIELWRQRFPELGPSFVLGPRTAGMAWNRGQVSSTEKRP